MGIANNIKLDSLDTLFGADNPNGITEISISALTEFKNHPFKVLNDEKMSDMIESIRVYGVLTPIIVRPNDDNYEIISGHRRKFACEQLGINKIPSIVKNLSDDEAIITMIDSNIQREEILPSERAFAYKMKLEAMKRQAGRPKNNSTQVGQNFKGKFSIEILAEEMGESRNQIQRYIRLTFLITNLLNMVDTKQIPFNTAVELSYLKESEQQLLLDTISKYNVIPSLKQATRLKTLSKENNLDENIICMVMTENTKSPDKISLKSSSLKKYFPENYTTEQMEEVIYKLLEDWSKTNK